MPRKTKKTSTAKPAATKPCDCSEAVLGTLGAICGIALMAAVINYVFFTPDMPKYGRCYKHRTDLTLAKVTNVGTDFGKYTDIEYSTVRPYFMYPTEEMKGRTRTFQSFSELYEKDESCLAFDNAT